VVLCRNLKRSKMAKLPLIFDNSILWGVIQVIEEPELQTPWAEFAGETLRGRPEYQIWVENESLRAAAKDALTADYALFKFRKNAKWYDWLLPSKKLLKEKLISKRDDLISEYEFLRRLIATDNVAIMINASR
jgi:hypothetical protein